MSCTQCKKPATQVCGACKDAPIIDGDIEKPRYCSSVCQKENWASHKKQCQRLQDRKVVYRVGSTAQLIFYLYRELTWCQFDIKKVEVDGIVLRLLGSLNRGGTWPADYRPFPTHLIQTKEHKGAILANKSCQEAAEIMVEFVGAMLKGIVTNLKDIHFYPKGEKCQMKLLPNLDYSLINIPVIVLDKREGDHEVLKLTLRSGEIFAVDLSGAQYGYHEPVIPWHVYEATRTRQFIDSGRLSGPRGTLDIEDFSRERQFREALRMCSRTSSPGTPGWVGILTTVNVLMLSWQEDENLAFKVMWNLPEEEFRKKQKSLMQEIETEMWKPCVNGKWQSQRE